MSKHAVRDGLPLVAMLGVCSVVAIAQHEWWWLAGDIACLATVLFIMWRATWKAH